jgi:hypothetical protein
MSFLGLNVLYDLDNCPLNTSPTNIRVADPEGKKVAQDRVEFIKVKFQEHYTAKLHAAIDLYW